MENLKAQTKIQMMPPKWCLMFFFFKCQTDIYEKTHMEKSVPQRVKLSSIQWNKQQLWLLKCVFLSLSTFCCWIRGCCLFRWCWECCTRRVFVCSEKAGLQLALSMCKSQWVPQHSVQAASCLIDWDAHHQRQHPPSSPCLFLLREHMCLSPFFPPLFYPDLLCYTQAFAQPCIHSVHVHLQMRMVSHTHTHWTKARRDIVM